MKTSELLGKLRGESLQGLAEEMKETQEELHKLKMQLVAKQLTNPHRIHEVKKKIARINSIITEKRMEESGGKA